MSLTFDNEQKVGRHSGRIREGSKQAISIITTVGIIEVNPQSRLQFRDAVRTEIDYSLILSKVKDVEKVYHDHFRKYRYNITNEILQDVVDEQFWSLTLGDALNDYIDIAIDTPGAYICPSCRNADQSIFSTCSNCNFQMDFFDHGYDKYHRTESHHICRQTSN